jgi:multiple sugar transport system substrate-binding protein
MEDSFTRRGFLRLAAGAAAAAAAGVGCNPGSEKPNSSLSAGEAGTKGERTLRIAQVSHFVPAYDRWFDDEHAKQWGEEHGVQVVVDHFPSVELTSRAAAEVAAQRGPDIFGFVVPPPVFEDEVIEHREIVREVEAKLGKMTPLVERSILNPKTGKYFAFSDFWAANLVNYRVDLWDRLEPGLRPNTWDDVLRAGPKLKAMGHPLGIGIGPALDPVIGLSVLMNAYGSSIQGEDNNLAINSPATVEAVKQGAAIFKAGMTDEVLTWDDNSNNRFLASGKGSLIVNPVSAVRAIEDQDPSLATQIALAPLPAGPARRLGPTQAMGVYVIWRFSRNQEAAKQFLVDLVLDYREAFVRSEFYNLPSFPGAVPDLEELVAKDAAQPLGKYALLDDATEWSTNLGHPGHVNAAVDEVVNQYLISKMFAAAARGEMSAQEAVKAAEAQMKPIFEKWREKGKI